MNELVSAGRGVAALIVGNRKAAQYFDLTTYGLVGSFIAFLFVTGLNVALPLLLNVPGASGSVLRSVMTIGILFGMQVLFSVIVLRQLKRLDGLVPYLVADNWATFFITVGSSLVGMTGIGGDALVVIVGILVIVVEINIARLIVTLSPLQIAMLLVAQLVGVSIGLLIIGLAFPLSPADLAALNSQPA